MLTVPKLLFPPRENKTLWKSTQRTLHNVLGDWYWCDLMVREKGSSYLKWTKADIEALRAEGLVE